MPIELSFSEPVNEPYIPPAAWSWLSCRHARQLRIDGDQLVLHFPTIVGAFYLPSELVVGTVVRTNLAQRTKLYGHRATVRVANRTQVEAIL